MIRFLAVLALTAAACGGAAAPTGTATPTGPTPVPTPTQRPTPSPTPSPEVITAACGEAMTPLFDALFELDARLDTGITHQAYGDALGEISIAYNRMDFDELAEEDPRCIPLVGLDLEKAFNAYIDGGKIWGDCIQSPSCEVDTFAPKFQAKWTEASEILDRVRDQFPDD
jgi:hypothetical protein